MDELREEILQSERTRSDLLKWKLGLAGTLGALGLGFSGSSNVKDAELVLVVIPLVCVYVDLLCLHLTLRIVVIGAFIRKARGTPEDKLLERYEDFAESARTLAVHERFGEAAKKLWPFRGSTAGRGQISAFALEDWALYLSTSVFSLSAIGYGFVALGRSGGIAALFLASGFVGLVATLIGKALYEMRLTAVTNLTMPTEPAA
jgi:hypothetical protein